MFLAGDIGIPPEVFRRIGSYFEPLFNKRYWVRLVVEEEAE
jgi:hypothetical protein